MPLFSVRCLSTCAVLVQKRKIEISGNFLGLEGQQDRTVFSKLGFHRKAAYRQLSN